MSAPPPDGLFEPRIYCKQCGYDLRACLVNRCSECGRKFDPTHPKTFSRSPPRGWLWRWTKRGLVVLFFMGVLLGGIWGWFYWVWWEDQQVLIKLGLSKTKECPQVTSIGGEWGEWLQEKRWIGFVLDRVYEIDILDKHLTDAGLMYVKDLKELQKLILYSNQVTDVGLVHVAELKSLQQLYVHGSPVTDAGLSHLKDLSRLQILDLDNCIYITDAGLVYLKDLRRLQSLSFRNCFDVTDTGLVYLKNLKELKYLNLDGTRVTQAGVQFLKAALPNCQIQLKRTWPNVD